MTQFIVNTTKVETYHVEVTKPTALEICAALDTLPSGSVLTAAEARLPYGVETNPLPIGWDLTFEVRS